MLSKNEIYRSFHIDRDTNIARQARSIISKANNRDCGNTAEILSFDPVSFPADPLIDLAVRERVTNVASSKRSIALLPTAPDLNNDRVVLGNFQIIELEWRSTSVLHCTPIEADYTLCVPKAGECHAGMATLLNPGQAFSENVSTAGRWLFIGIARRSIEQMLVKLIGRALKQPVLFDSVIDLGTSFGQSLRSAIEFLARLADPVAISSSLIQAEIESALLACLLKGVKNNYSDEILYQTQGAYACHVQKARAFIESHLHEEIDLADIAAAVGISPRLLQKVFAQKYNCSPMRFVTQMRTIAIRRELQQASPTTRITDVMMSYGITQGGKFAKEYQQLFGEKPSDTLKRAIADRQPLWREIDDRRSEGILGGVAVPGYRQSDYRDFKQLPPLGTTGAWMGYHQAVSSFFYRAIPSSYQG